MTFFGCGSGHLHPRTRTRTERNVETKAVITVQDYNKTLRVSTFLAHSFWPTIFVETSKLTGIAKDYIRVRRPHGARADWATPLLNDVIQADSKNQK